MYTIKGNLELTIDNKVYAEILNDLRFTDGKVNDAVKVLLQGIGIPNFCIEVVLEKIINGEYDYDHNEQSIMIKLIL